MTDRTTGDTRLVIPALGSVYRALDPYMDALVRVFTGLMLIPHGMQKLFGAFGGGGISGTAEFLESVGYTPGLFWAWVLAVLETFGGLALVLGLFTRPVALLVFIFMANAVAFHMPNGFFWNRGGYEYPLFWAAMALFCMVRGGGRWSLDAKLGREL